MVLSFRQEWMWGSACVLMLVGFFLERAYLTSANVDGRSTMRAPPKSGVEEYVVMIVDGYLVIWFFGIVSYESVVM